MLTSEIISKYLAAVSEGIAKDAAAKSQKIPVKSFRTAVNEVEGKLFAADYFKYLVTGRGPGKFPPPDAMLKHVQDNPQMLTEARKIWKYISEKGLAFLIGRKIARYGTDIFTGRKPGIDLTGAVEAPMEDFLKQVAYHQALTVAGEIRESVAA